MKERSFFSFITFVKDFSLKEQKNLLVLYENFDNIFENFEIIITISDFSLEEKMICFFKEKETKNRISYILIKKDFSFTDPLQVGLEASIGDIVLEWDNISNELNKEDFSKALDIILKNKKEIILFYFESKKILGISFLKTILKNYFEKIIESKQLRFLGVFSSRSFLNKKLILKENIFDKNFYYQKISLNTGFIN